ncbi:dephospho-CoA kinase [Shewanella submarina]|uniref:Dephospho-CoA kinase n=1 Tax=Shewanella submarina TaxID=2016376 RepID=A0ABV7G5I4_9GAMM|nr:dephospho-CoA kinase [Shewanella submarina]MCL1038283.1 dephospho-CoA kinase [Shewanella submarina]
MSRFRIGLTGGIGSGKTTVANLFAKQGITLVDADIIARQVVEPGSPGLSAIVTRHGQEMLLPDASLDRRKLRGLVFNHPDEREWLNALLHPLIRQEMLKQLQQATSPYVILVVPLLFENGLDSLVNQTVLVDIPSALQITRTSQRDDVDEAQVQSIINSQMSREDKLARADYVIDNQGDLVQLEHQVMQLHKQFLEQAKLSPDND